MAVKRKAILKHGALVECPTHKRRRSFRPAVAKPTNKCPVCWACWVADKLETNIYEDDLSDLISFSNAFTTTMKPSSIEFIESMKDD